MLIDTHCHLNDPSFALKLDEVIARARAVHIQACIVPAYDVESLPRTAALAGKYPEIYLAFGLHPMYLNETLPLEKIASLCTEFHAVAVGEIGLDFTAGCAAPDIQVRQLRQQLELAVSLNLPVILHTRKSVDLMYRLLQEYRGRLRGVLHSFSGGAPWAMKFVELGFHISFSGSLTRPSARKYHDTAQAVPAERILLETDAPSIRTETTDAEQVEPRHTWEMAQKLAELRNQTVESVAAQTTANARKLFGLGKNTESLP